MEKEAVVFSKISVGDEVREYNCRGELFISTIRSSYSKHINKIYQNDLGESFKILGNLDKRGNNNGYSYFLIEFQDATRLVVNGLSISHLNIPNPNTPTVQNIGFKGVGRFNFTTHHKEYITWTSMLKRCYNEGTQTKHPSYKGCTTEERWHNFQNFCEDIQHLEGYKEWKENTLPKKYALDKDIRIKGNKIYSKDTCMFVTERDNIIASQINGESYLAIFLETGYKEEFNNIKKFARENSLSATSITRHINSTNTIYKGWSFRKLSEEEVE